MLAELKDAKLGAQNGTTSYDAIGSIIKPTQKPSVFTTNDIAVQALKNEQMDGLVVDLPTALYMAAAQIKDGVDRRAAPVGRGKPEQFGLLLDKGTRSPRASRRRSTRCAPTARWHQLRPSGWPAPTARRSCSRARLAAVERSSRSGSPTGAAGPSAQRRPIAAVSTRPGHRRWSRWPSRSTPGWPRFRSSFLDLSYGRAVLPDIAKGLWLNVRLMVVCEVVILVLGLLLALGAVPARPGLLPDPGRRDGLHRRLPRSAPAARDLVVRLRDSRAAPPRAAEQLAVLGRRRPWC